jgi:hypothetical protein
MWNSINVELYRFYERNRRRSNLSKTVNWKLPFWNSLEFATMGMAYEDFVLKKDLEQFGV